MEKRSKKEVTGYLSDAFNNGYWNRIFIQLIYSNSAVCRVYLGGEATAIYAAGGGYDKNGACLGQVGLLIKTDDEEYIDAMKHRASGAGDMAGAIDDIARKLTEAQGIKWVGSYQQSKEGYSIAFIKVV